ncbi:MAG: GNAT family N-acetyltransferase [Alphaproteobacteria bacterium]|nr:GNAT family N-acetyltransferase [Alphaproteobacteria bacterium]
MTATIRSATEDDFDAVVEIVNTAAEAYRDVIPAACWHEPYMPDTELATEIAAGVEFSLLDDSGEVLGVMGIQDRGAVYLIRHAYVRPAHQGRGIGTRLLMNLLKTTDRPVLIGTWAAAHWAIRFYQHHGFAVVTETEKNRLLKTYWTIPERQIENSVVLADRRFQSMANGART